MRAEWIPRREYEHLLAALMPANRLALEIAETNGLRISDALSLRTDKLASRMTIKELKTGKSRRIYLSRELLARAQALAGRYWVFEGRTDPRKHRTRQAVYKDLKRVARIFRLDRVATHTGRKIFAVEQFHKTGSLKAVQKLMNHRDEAVTVLYAMADQLSKRVMENN